MSELEIYKKILNDLGWRLENNGSINKNDWIEIVLPKLKLIKG